MERAEKLKSIRQIGNVVQATQTLPPSCLHSWILLHYVSDWSICHGEKGNCNGTRIGKTWIMDGYYWELKGENSSITRQEAIEIVHFFPFLFHWFPGFKDALYLLFSALNLQQSHHFAGPMNFALRIWSWCSADVVSGYLYHCRNRRMIHKFWALCIPNAREKNQKGCKNSKLLPRILEGNKTCSQWPKPQPTAENMWMPTYNETWTFLTTSLETPNPSCVQMDEIHAAVHTDFHYISKQSRSHSAKLRGELLKTQRIFVRLKKHHSYPSTQKRCLLSCEVVILFQDTCANSRGFYHRVG